MSKIHPKEQSSSPLDGIEVDVEELFDDFFKSIPKDQATMDKKKGIAAGVGTRISVVSKREGTARIAVDAFAGDDQIYFLVGEHIRFELVVRADSYQGKRTLTDKVLPIWEAVIKGGIEETTWSKGFGQRKRIVRSKARITLDTGVKEITTNEWGGVLFFWTGEKRLYEYLPWYA